MRGAAREPPRRSPNAGLGDLGFTRCKGCLRSPPPAALWSNRRGDGQILGGREMKARAPIRMIVAPPPRHSRSLPRYSRSPPRHSRESGNPQTNNVILAKAGTSSPREIKYESRATNPFSLYGLAGVGLHLNSRPQSRACARRTLILAFSHKGRRDPLASIRT